MYASIETIHKEHKKDKKRKSFVYGEETSDNVSASFAKRSLAYPIVKHKGLYKSIAPYRADKITEESAEFFESEKQMGKMES